MKLTNPDGHAVYYNEVTKHGKSRWQIQAADKTTVIYGRDGQKRKSRTFTQEHQARAYLVRNGYKIVEESKLDPEITRTERMKRMDLIFDYDNNGYYWQIFDDGTQRTSQLFDSPSEAWKALRENRIVWN